MLSYDTEMIVIDRKKEITYCKLCKLTYNQDLIRPDCLIPCGHVFCKSCILKTKLKNCPDCNQSFSQIIPDFEMMDIVSGLPALSISQSPQLNQPQEPLIQKPNPKNKEVKFKDEPKPIKDEQVPETKQENKIQDKMLKPEIIHLIMEGTRSQQLMGTVAVRKLLSRDKNPPIEEVIEANLVPKFTEFLSSSDQTLQFEAAWALTNVASGNSDQTKTVIRSGSIPQFINLIKSPNEQVQEQAIWALGNIAGNGVDSRDEVLDRGILLPLLKIITNMPKNKSLITNSVWCLSNLCRGKPGPDITKINPAIPVLNFLLDNSDEEVLIDTLWALSYLSDGPNTNIQLVIDSIDLKKVVGLFSKNNNKLNTPALRAIGNIVTGDDTQTQIVLDLNVMPILQGFLQNQKESLVKEACWVISNITAGTKDQLQTVIDAGVFPKILDLCKSDNLKIKKEALWVVANAVKGGTMPQIEYLIGLNVLEVLCNALEDCLEEKKHAEIILETFIEIFKTFDKNKNEIVYDDISQRLNKNHSIKDTLAEILEDDSLAESTRSLAKKFNKLAFGGDDDNDDDQESDDKDEEEEEEKASDDNQDVVISDLKKL